MWSPISPSGVLIGALSNFPNHLAMWPVGPWFWHIKIAIGTSQDQGQRQCVTSPRRNFNSYIPALLSSGRALLNPPKKKRLTKRSSKYFKCASKLAFISSFPQVFGVEFYGSLLILRRENSGTLMRVTSLPFETGFPLTKQKRTTK